MRIEREVVAPAAAEAVFAIIADWTAQTEWQPTIERVEAAGPLGLGARVVEERAGYGQHMVFDVDVIAWEPPTRVRVHAHSRSRIPLDAEEEFVIEPRGESSLVRMALEFDLPLVLRPLAHGVGIEAGKQLDDALARLRERVASMAGRPA